MPDLAQSNPAAFESPDLDRVYLNYLESCQRQGIEPVPRDRARTHFPVMGSR